MERYHVRFKNQNLGYNDMHLNKEIHLKKEMYLNKEMFLKKVKLAKYKSTGSMRMNLLRWLVFHFPY